MRVLPIAILAAVLIKVAFPHAQAEPITIKADGGGSLAVYEARAITVKANHQAVIIDGPCGSACVAFADQARSIRRIP